VRKGEVLVREGAAVDGFAAGAVAGREVAALEHELGDDTEEVFCCFVFFWFLV
jgi:hypothetical protein